MRNNPRFNFDPAPVRRRFRRLGPLICLLASLSTHATGPMVGTVTPTSAHLLFRPETPGPLRLVAVDESGREVASAQAMAAEEHDRVAHFRLDGLSPATRYRYRVESVADDGSRAVLAGGDADHAFRTALPPGTPGKVTAGFLSCAKAVSDPVFARLDALGIDALFLGGDTPYIDSPELAVARQKHRDFLRIPALAALVRHVPTVGTWDDHDFGANNGNGASFAAKAVTLRAFAEYRAHDQYGTGAEGVYHRVNTGPLEVFLLDPRFFSQTTTNVLGNARQPTCFGPAQWAWLLDGLRRSTAPFKVLMMGQIWQDKKNSETDDMFTYWQERDALFDFVRDQRIPGVVLVGGDIHVSRHLVHPLRVGYDLHDFVTSPAHTSVIPSLDVYHPDLEWSSRQPLQFLTLTADTTATPPVLTARYHLHDGTVQRTVVIPYDRLTPRAEPGLARDRVAAWSFDADGANRGALGARVNLQAVNGAALAAPGGVRGGCAVFSRAREQYLFAPRSLLPDNAAQYTVSLWCRAASLPAHGAKERQFLIETTPEGGTSGEGSGYGISLGFRACEEPGRVNLDLHTHTLRPPKKPGAAPEAAGQGGFATLLDRALFLDRWTQVAVTFDSRALRLFVNGALVATHALPEPGPLSENGGVVLGGHRGGTGRNLDGALDEVAVWSRVLTNEEIQGLWAKGEP